jgi:DNA invertase Pin-like site-specific DNA recombinase
MDAMKYGYARTSTDDQTTALQLEALKQARCSHIFEDKGRSGATARRPALVRCLKTLRAGDTLIVWKLDRLGPHRRSWRRSAPRGPRSGPGSKRSGWSGWTR